MPAKTYRIVVGLVVVFICAHGAAARSLTFEERVSAQRAIERVYYSHQISVTLPFEQVIPREVSESKVRRYLELSAALEHFWNAPLEPQELFGEMTRMATSSASLARLRELFAALGDDPFLIQECLVRPVLAERSARQFFDGDRSLQSTSGERESWDEWWSRNREGLHVAEAPAVAWESVALPELNAAEGVTCTPGDSWEPISNALAPAGGTRAIWTGSHMVVWGGGELRNEGGRYDPATDSWSPTSTLGAPESRDKFSVVWSGSEALIWGGIEVGSGGPAVNTGARYNPISDAWSPMSSAPIAGARGHTAVWTGSEMIIFGGTFEPLTDFGGTRVGVRYDPSIDNWSTISLDGPLPRYNHAAVWTGSEMIVWGGKFGFCCDPPTYPTVGGVYDPSTDSWQLTNAVGAPGGRDLLAAFWTGNEMIVWGGRGPQTSRLGDGARYDQASDSWADLPSVNAPSARSVPLGTWLPPYFVIAGSQTIDGALYDTVADQWLSMDTTGAPEVVSKPVSTGVSMLCWGSTAGGGRYTVGDPDGDGICADVDNCAAVSNSDQTDQDGDNLGDGCDGCPADPDNDADLDGVCGDVDVCPATFNPDQELIVFGEPIVATSTSGLSWLEPSDVDFVRGDLADVSVHGVIDSGVLFDATFLDVSGNFVTPGNGLYYLIRETGECGSWQTSLGRELGRDQALP